MHGPVAAPKGAFRALGMLALLEAVNQDESRLSSQKSCQMASIAFMLHPINVQMPGDENIQIAFETGEAAVMARHRHEWAG